MLEIEKSEVETKVVDGVTYTKYPGDLQWVSEVQDGE